MAPAKGHIKRGVTRCRKKHLRENEVDGMMHVSLFDSDKCGPQWLDGLRRYLNPDDLLGSGILNMEELKKPGVHSFHMQMGKSGWFSNLRTTVHFTVEYMSFKGMDTGKGRRRVRPSLVSVW